MALFALHAASGTVGALALFLFFSRLSGERSFSLPTAVFVIGLSCGLLAHYASPWATPGVLLLYGLAAADECRRTRRARADTPSEGA